MAANTTIAMTSDIPETHANEAMAENRQIQPRTFDFAAHSPTKSGKMAAAAIQAANGTEYAKFLKYKNVAKGVAANAAK